MEHIPKFLSACSWISSKPGSEITLVEMAAPCGLWPCADPERPPELSPIHIIKPNILKSLYLWDAAYSLSNHISSQTTLNATYFLPKREFGSLFSWGWASEALCTHCPSCLSLLHTAWCPPAPGRVGGLTLWSCVDNLDLMGNNKQFLASLKSLKILRKTAAFPYYSHSYFGV